MFFAKPNSIENLSNTKFKDITSNMVLYGSVGWYGMRSIVIDWTFETVFISYSFIKITSLIIWCLFFEKNGDDGLITSCK